MQNNCEIMESYDDYMNKTEIKTIGNREYVTGFYASGNKMYEEEYKDGKLEGKWTGWYESGEKEEEGEYKNGEKEGKWTTWYKSGTVKCEEEYKDGKHVGKLIGWYDHGDKAFEMEYEDGNLISWQHFKNMFGVDFFYYFYIGKVS